MGDRLIGKLLVAGAAVALLAAACGGGGGGGQNTGGGTPTASPGGGGQSPTSSPTSGGGKKSALTVTQNNFAFTPSKATVKSGSTISVTDANPTTAHTFTIQGKGIDVVNSPNQTQTVQINLPPGTYQFMCRFHFALGMKGTLTVT